MHKCQLIDGRGEVPPRAVPTDRSPRQSGTRALSFKISLCRQRPRQSHYRSKSDSKLPYLRFDSAPVRNHGTKTQASKHQRHTWWFSRVILFADTPVAAPPAHSRFGQCGQGQLPPSPTKHHDQRNILFLRMRLLTAA
jgi:hypothetical protein